MKKFPNKYEPNKFSSLFETIILYHEKVGYTKNEWRWINKKICHCDSPQKQISKAYNYLIVVEKHLIKSNNH